MLSESMENYLKAIHEVLEHEERATTSSIAERLSLAAPSVTAMIKKLAEMDLLTYEPYHGVRLTAQGQKKALEVVRHHRLIELYLARALDVPWDRVHDEAEKLEHVISEDLESRMAAALGDPRVDPHGAPIPALDGSVRRVATVALSEVAAGGRVEISEVDDRDPELLRYLGALELFPGTRIEVVGAEPYGGSLRLLRDGREFVLGLAAARQIRVRRATTGGERS